MDDRNKATEAILRKKPFGLRFKPVEVAFLVTYKERDGMSYLSYIRNEVRFKMRLETKTFLYQLHDRIRDGRYRW